MSVPMLNKMHMNGYDVLSVNNGPWRVCTEGDRLGAFASREEHWPLQPLSPVTSLGLKSPPAVRQRINSALKPRFAGACHFPADRAVFD